MQLQRDFDGFVYITPTVCAISYLAWEKSINCLLHTVLVLQQKQKWPLLKRTHIFILVHFWSFCLSSTTTKPISVLLLLYFTHMHGLWWKINQHLLILNSQIENVDSMWNQIFVFVSCFSPLREHFNLISQKMKSFDCKTTIISNLFQISI